MWAMACGATFNLHGRMFDHKGTAFLDVTVDTNFPVCLPQHWLIVCAVSVVAVRTLHQTFWNTVVYGQCELCLNSRMALVAHAWLRQTQEALCQPTIIFFDSRCTEKLCLRKRRFNLVPDSPCFD